MADNLQNTSSVDTNITSKAALVTDLNSSYHSKEMYSHARNIVRNSKDGDLGTVGNEPSNLSCISAPYKILGHVDLPDGTFLVFSGDETDSEIGIGNPKDCTYTKVKNLPCFNFSQFNQPIHGVAKKDFHKGTVVTFTDKANPVRRVELKSLANLTSCDDILLWKKIDQPCISVKKGNIGNMPNGSYSVVIAYSVDNQVFTDWFSITNRRMLFSETNSNSLEITLSNLDTEFDEFTLGVVGTYIDPNTKGVTKLAKKIGTYSTKIKSVSVTDFINPTYEEIPLSQLVVKRNTWNTAGIITSNSNYLIIADLVGRDEENYQLKAMQIETEYVVKQVLADYYQFDGEDVGYYRDENYDFYIQGEYNTGEVTDKYNIGGRIAEDDDLSPVSSADVYEYDKDYVCEIPGTIVRWQVENTAGKMVPYNNEFSCGTRLLGYGAMGYFESTEPWPDNVAMFGDDAGKPRRLHKMPDECKVPRYSIIDGKQYVNVLGVRFKNIPKFDSPDIVGYRITRSDRKGGNGTVVARGIITNTRFYDDVQTQQTVLYSNYNVNDLSPDQYLSSTQTSFKNGKEHNFTPLTGYYKDKFNFYSPHTSFEPKYSLGNELKIESEEIADITGSFEKVHNHPRQKLLNQFAFWLAAATGFIETTLVLLGKANMSGQTETEVTVPPVRKVSVGTKIEINSVDDLISLSPGQLTAMIINAIQALDGGGILAAANLIFTALKVLASLGLKAAYGTFKGIEQADQIFNVIYNFTGYTDYVYQYNSHALFTQSLCVADGNKRRRLISDPEYIPSDVVTINDKTFNNYFSEKSVFLELNKPITDPVTKDTSRNTISGFGMCEKPTDSITSKGSAFYATSKVTNPNQYGTVGSASPVSMHSCVIPFTQDIEESPVLFGGDCIIARVQIQKRKQFFSQHIANINYPDGTEYDYRLYNNIGYPRFWIDSTKYDFSQLLSGNVVNFTKFSRTTTSKHNLDCKGGDKKSISRIDDAYMYLASNCVMDFFVECDYNIHFREKTEHPFYYKNNTNLSQIFRSDRWEFPEEFQISRAYSDIYTTEISAIQQRDDFDPTDPIPISQPNSVIYSLPSFNLQQVDNWQYFLPANYFAFRESDFGSLTGIHKLDQDRLIFLFSKSSPYVSMGKDFLELEGSGRKVTIGDGGLFAQDPREMLPTDNNYGSCNSRWAFSNTHLGRFYPSEKQGRIINADSMEDIARAGLSFWCKNYMPIFLYKYFPSYPEVENPISGVGYYTIFDSFNETFYVTKRDFSPKPEYKADISYHDGSFYYKSTSILLRSQYFNDISWTLSYCPQDKGFVSWHDWHPDWVIQAENHFMTVKDNIIYKHNERYDSFCNFYGIDYPSEIEVVSSSGQQVHIPRSIEYLWEAYKYKNSGRDKFHVHHENFDRLVVSNTEQISPLLKLNYASDNVEDNLEYPKRDPSTAVTFNILFHKEENKYRINQFWDTVKDRGEFTRTEAHLFPTDESGYKNVVNPLAVDMNKPEEERKKFRHYFNKFRFTKTVSGSTKFLFKLLNVKKLVSIR
jgi:hypothetical protein